MRRRSFVGGLAAVVGSAAVASPAAAVTPRWSALPMPAAGADPWASQIAARGPREAWATGSALAGDGTRLPFLYRWDGTAWSRDTTFPGPDVPGWLRDVEFVGDEVWFFRSRDGAGEILRRSAQGWSTVPLPQTLWYYQDFTAAQGAAWVVGEDDTGMKVLHYDGSGWTTQPNPDGVLFIAGVTARTATDAWARADLSDGGDIILHWDGTAWRDAQVPLPPDSNVHKLLLEPDNRITIGGWQRVGEESRAFVMTFNGRTWRTTYPPLGEIYLERMARGPDGALWVPVISDRAFQSKYARVDGRRVTFSYGPERTNAIEVKAQELATVGSSLMSFGTAEIYGSKPNLMSERLGG
ncbi:hypothetical protein [Streptomyces sp. NBC_01304]|uniref:hypothetical protein n=1 Tax=Streptomyces sp. NBC_01304 TaxID=2903818 RepID=UPI002E1530CB|nr:hypothetical protein OG430_03985 [Streptomyces sp. NBC_01304]